jgi:hypothetical protein
MRALAVLSLLVLASAGTGAAPKAPPSPADDLRVMQGRWQLKSIYWPIDDKWRLPKEARLNESDTALVIAGNKLLHDGKVVATLANDLPLPAQQKEIGFGGNRLLMLTLPDGKALLCSYRSSPELVQLTYTHRCSCHRGSGQVIYLERPAK